MNDEERTALAESVERALAGVPGVAEVLRPGGALSTAVDLGARAMGIREADAPRVRVTDADGATLVEASIGVASSSAKRTTRDAHRAIREVAGPVRVVLTVAHVDARSVAVSPHGSADQG